MSTLNKRDGVTNYDQVIGESGKNVESVVGNATRNGTDTTTSKGDGVNNVTGKTISKSNQDTKTTRNLESNSAVNRTSTEKVNIGFVISFKVSNIGRFPTGQGGGC